MWNIKGQLEKKYFQNLKKDEVFVLYNMLKKSPWKSWVFMKWFLYKPHDVNNVFQHDLSAESQL